MSADPLGEADIRLIVTDMDGTLLDGDGAIPNGFWSRFDALRERGIVLVPASGRQYGMISRLFGRVLDGLVVIAENGSYVVQDGVELSSVTVEREQAVSLVQAVRSYAAEGNDIGLVVCGKRSAYIERTDPLFAQTSGEYYAFLTAVDDALAHDDDILKIAIVDFDGRGRVAEALASFAESHQIVVSGKHWVDVMSHAVNKGVAVRALQQRLGVTPAQTVVFGDYFNDLQMFEAAEHSFAMANAHPDVRARARYMAESNVDHGVLRVLDRILAAR